tara:strand:- start:578 stop:1504 length:927 start_codon:yes stop_codon:yes gene_type:complete
MISLTGVQAADSSQVGSGGVSTQQLQDILAKVQSMAQSKTAQVADPAFDKTKRALFPLSPDQIHELRYEYNRTKQASEVTEKVPPKPVASAIVVNLSPGSTPPVVRLASGFVTSLIFLDSSGEPWPIKAYDIGDPQAFNIQWKPSTPDEEKSGESMGNTMLIQSSSMYRQGNLAVMLRGLNTPIMLTLIPGQRVVDYRLDVQVPGLGPLGNSKEMTSLPTEANPDLLNVLNNIPPVGGKALSVSGADGHAWLAGNTLYLRTPLTLISPSWVSTMSSSDGLVHAYTLTPASVLLALHHGKLVKLKVKGF